MKLNEALKILNSGQTPLGLQLNLHGNHIGDEGTQTCAEALLSDKCPSELQLILADNQIGPKGAEALAKALASGLCPAGLYLNIASNDIGVKGTHAIAEALASGQCPSDLQLDLSVNNIGDAGAQALADALYSGKFPPGLHLIVYANQIGDEGAQAFAKALSSEHCRSGLDLDLRLNHIGDKGVEALADTLITGNCRFGTTIRLTNMKYNLAELSEKNNESIHQAALGIAILIGGFSHHNKQPTSILMKMLPKDIVNHIAGFLPGHISSTRITTFLKKLFCHLMKTNSEFSQTHRSNNQHNQHIYDKQYGLSLWKSRDYYKNQLQNKHAPEIEQKTNENSIQ